MVFWWKSWYIYIYHGRIQWKLSASVLVCIYYHLTRDFNPLAWKIFKDNISRLWILKLTSGLWRTLQRFDPHIRPAQSNKAKPCIIMSQCQYSTQNWFNLAGPRGLAQAPHIAGLTKQNKCYRSKNIVVSNLYLRSLRGARTFALDMNTSPSLKLESWNWMLKVETMIADLIIMRSSSAIAG